MRDERCIIADRFDLNLAEVRRIPFGEYLTERVRRQILVK